MLNQRLSESQTKADQFDKISQTNKDLVTRNCALKSSIQAKDKDLMNMSDRVRELEAVIQKLETQSEQTGLMSQSFNQAKTAQSSMVRPSEAAQIQPISRISSKNPVGGSQKKKQEPRKADSVKSSVASKASTDAIQS